ncbi:MAG: DndE family protein [Deltaproteobacteria bacterium]|nr:DndE family protein [Deltaproteobacteria bacterium]
MTQININTSEKNHKIVSELTRKLSIKEENIIARIAICYSLSKNKRLDINDMGDSKGKLYKEFTLLGEKRDFYIALICLHYKIDKNHPDISKYFKLHLDNGLELINKIFQEDPARPIFDFLISRLETGLDVLENVEVSFDYAKNPYQNIDKEYFGDLIKLAIGKKTDSEEEIIIEINDTSKYNNPHIAVAGESGSGKTQFALELLTQFYINSNKQIKFLYLDFKGLKQGEELSGFYKNFFDINNAEYITKPFPLNPLSFIDNVNKDNKIEGIHKFVDIIAKFGNIGDVKKQILKQALKDAFNNKKNGEYPSFKEIYDNVMIEEDNKPSKLTGILDNLQEFNLFETERAPIESFINKNYYLSLSRDLPSDIQLITTFLIINYIYNVFMNMKKVSFKDNIMPIRYILLIDEAHVIFKEKKSKDILEKMLREIRSQGVSVILLSQGIEEFNQPTFDFSSMCNTAFLLNIKEKHNIKPINKFMGYNEKAGKKAKQSVSEIENIKAGAISNIKEYEQDGLLKLKQFYERI